MPFFNPPDSDAVFNAFPVNPPIVISYVSFPQIGHTSFINPLIIFNNSGLSITLQVTSITSPC